MVDFLLHGEGVDGTSDIVDSGDGKIPLTTSGVTHSTTDPKVGSASLYFDGANHARIYPDLYHLFDCSDNADFWVSFWFKPTIASRQVIFGQSDGGGGNASIGIWAEWTGTQIRAGYMATTADVGMISDVTPALNQWHHVALQRDGMSMRLYVDGTLAASRSDLLSYTPNFNIAYRMALGGFGGLPSILSFTGYLDEFAFNKGEVKFTENFVPSTEPLADNNITDLALNLTSWVSDNTQGAPNNISDNDPATYVQGMTYIKTELGTAAVVDRIQLCVYDSAALAAQAGVFEGSDNGTDWTTLTPINLTSYPKVTPQAWPGWIIDYEFDNTHAYKHYRLSGMDGTTSTVISELRMLQSVTAGDPEPPVVHAFQPILFIVS